MAEAPEKEAKEVEELDEVEIIDAEPDGDADSAKPEDKGEDVDVDGKPESAEQQADAAGHKPKNRVPAKKRIDELTRDKRDLERMLANSHAQLQTVQAESERKLAEVNDRVAKLESTYTADSTEQKIAQAERQVEANLAAVKQRIKDAADNTDNAALVEAQTELAQLVHAKSRIGEFKAVHQREREKPVEQPKPQEREQQPQIDPQHAYLANKWAAENEWFRTNRQLHVLARAIDDELTEEHRRTGRFDPRSEDRWTEINRRMEPYLVAAGARVPIEDAAPEQTKQTPQASRPSITAAVAGVTRALPGQTGKTVYKLTAEEAQTADDLGVDRVAYAKQKQRMLERLAANPRPTR